MSKKTVTLQDLANSSTKTTGDAEEIKKTETKTTTEPMASNPSGGKMKEISPSDIRSTLPEKEVEPNAGDKTPEILDNAMRDMVKTMEGKKKKFDEEIRPKLEEARREAEIEAELAEAEAADEEPMSEEDELEAMLNEELDNEEDEAETISEPEPDKVVKISSAVEDDETPAPKKKAAKKQTTSAESDLDDEVSNLNTLLGDLEQDMGSTTEDVEIDGEEDIETVEEIRERLKNQSSKLKSAKSSVDRSGYSIAKKSVNSSTLLNKIKKNKAAKTADWPLLATGRNHTFTAADGPELEALQKSIQNSNSLNGIIASLRFIYNHIEDANKPGFERWCKLTKYEDLESLYFGIYKACYGDVNLIGRTDAKSEDDKTDEHCGKTSVIDTPIDSMYKFEDDEAKALFEKLYEQDTTTANTEIESTIFEVSDELAVAYSEPTLYTTLIQFSSLNPNIVEKHDTLLNTLAYIDDFYLIDDETKQYIRLDYKVYPDNLNKTIMSKLKAYVEFCKCITSDQYDAMVAKITQAVDKESKISYILPETVCPECGATIPEEAAGSMLELLFTHRQLTAIANS